jgi:hypothetical protein
MAGKSIDQTTAKLIFEVVLLRYISEEGEINHNDIPSILKDIEEIFAKYE